MQHIECREVVTVFITIKKWTILYVISMLLLVVGFVTIFRQGATVQSSAVQNIAVSPILILDPGHGGEDGGAVAQDGTIESHINLSIAEKAARIAELCGLEICMTRKEDVSIHDSSAETIREKKVSDLKNRAALCNSIDNGVLISFHQNSLPGSASVRGAQVFYNDKDGSRELAQAIQELLNETLNSSHPKTIKSIGESSYLMSHAECPAVLIECAFLSNPEETMLIKSDKYQTKLAVAIISAAICHLSDETK